MEAATIIGFSLALLIGVSLGLVGSGGSILTVPIMVYVFGILPETATAYSLFVVGLTAVVGGVKAFAAGQVNIKAAMIFGFPSVVAVYMSRLVLLPMLPATICSVGQFQFTKNMLLMVAFAVLMILASVFMIKPCKTCNDDDLGITSFRYNYKALLFQGFGVGLVTGMVGAGGGFLIIPALVFFARMPIKKAMGTSLSIISFNSLLGFAAYAVHGAKINWSFLLGFSCLAIVGILFGLWLSSKIAGVKLKKGFGWFVLAMGIYILVVELGQ